MNATIAERIANLSPTKQALLKKKLQQQNIKKANSISHRTDAGYLPLSLTQERLWFLDQLETANIAYNDVVAMRLTGNLDTSALEAALATLVERHPIFRTHYHQLTNSAIQIIDEEMKIPLHQVDLRALALSEHATAIQQAVKKEASQPFDLSIGPMARFVLLRMDDQEYVFLRTVHHIAFDGWSNNIFWQELNQLYNAYHEGREPKLPELSIDYADYSVWQRQWLNTESGTKQNVYWRKQLAGLSPLELPTDRPRPARQTYNGSSHAFLISDTVTVALNKLAYNERASLFMVLLTTFQVLLHRYSGQHDIAVGSPIACRTHLETEQLIGFFANTLVLRNNLAGNPSFRELLQQVRTTCLSAYANQDLPFSQVVAELQPERSLSLSPLFQVLFVLQNAPQSSWQLMGVTAEQLEVSQETAKFDLSLSLHMQAAELKATFEYNTDLFDAATIKRMTSHFCTLLAGIAQSVDKPIGQILLLTSIERQQLLNERNDTSTQYPQDKNIHQLFEEKVEQTPDAVAVVFKDIQLTYLELNQRVNQLARFLLNHKPPAESVVGICLHRTPQAIIALLGVLKAGGAFLLLDPKWPSKRIETILLQAQAN